jgi:hypothetical protein
VNAQGRQILDYLEQVAAERMRRRVDAGLGERVQAIKQYQHRRFERTYADMLVHPRFAKAARFFLEDLYGPEDFSLRDEQFARIVPALVRLFPSDIVGTVVALAELHALSERLDGAMASALRLSPPDATAYAEAWRIVGDAAARERQIQLMMQVGGALERHTRNPLLRHTLRLMRSPAQAAGLGALQAFLEKGFDTFREMRGAREFLDTIATRERALAARLFAGGVADATDATG